MTFQTSIAGSLPKPSWLAEPEKLWAPWRLQGADLVAGQRDATLIWLKEQEDAGIDIVTDGEQSRIHFVHGFLEHIDGIDWGKKTRMGIRDNRYVVEVPTVTAAVKRKGPVHSNDMRFARAHTTRTLKIELPGPMEARELAALGVDVIQFDEPAFNVFMDDVREWGVAALEEAIKGLDCKTAVHICYGYGIKPNIEWKQTLGSEWRQYEEIFPAINSSRIGMVSLECAGSKVPMSLISLLSDKEIMIGAIDVATNRVETPEEVASVLKAATKYASPGRIYGCSNCGLAPLPRDVAVDKLRALVSGAALLRKETSGK